MDLKLQTRRLVVHFSSDRVHIEIKYKPTIKQSFLLSKDGAVRTGKGRVKILFSVIVATVNILR